MNRQGKNKEPDSVRFLLGVIFGIVIIAIISGGGTRQAIVTEPTKTQPFVPPAQTSTPTITPTPTKVPCTELTGQIEKISIPSETLGQPIAVNIYLPPCYSADNDKVYPVLYMLHGQASNNSQWLDLGIADSADQLLYSGTIQPYLIVMPYEVSWRVGPEVSKYGTSLIEEVIPYIDDNYKVCASRSCRAIGGLSRGGNWAVNLAFSHPELFTAIGAHSTPLFFGEMSRIELAVNALKSTQDLPLFYIDMGNKDENRLQILAFVDLLKKWNVAYTFNQFLGYHDANYWAGHVADYLTWYSGQFILP
jgi:enterochelin esterase-like enzyme